MISETMPLNEWPSIMLHHLLIDLEFAGKAGFHTTIEMISVVKTAIKDAEEREAKLPFK